MLKECDGGIVVLRYRLNLGSRLHRDDDASLLLVLGKSVNIDIFTGLDTTSYSCTVGVVRLTLRRVVVQCPQSENSTCISPAVKKNAGRLGLGVSQAFYLPSIDIPRRLLRNCLIL